MRYVYCSGCGASGLSDDSSSDDLCPKCEERREEERYEAEREILGMELWGERSELFAPPRNEYHGD